MKFGLLQMNVLTGQLNKNLQTALDGIARARDQKCELIALPEMCLSGYLLGDLWNSSEFRNSVMEVNEKLRMASQGIVLIFGSAHFNYDAVNRDGRPQLLNAGFVYKNQLPITHNSSLLPPGMTVKSLQPNYRVFDDDRYFTSLLDLSLAHGISTEEVLPVFKSSFGFFGVEICEDLWSRDYQVSHEEFSVSRLLKKKGAELIFNISASPWSHNKSLGRDKQVLHTWQGEEGIPLAYVNCVGVQNNGKNFVCFDGDSSVYNSFGKKIVSHSKRFAEELITADSREFTQLPVLRQTPELRPETYVDTAIYAIKSLDLLMGSSNWPMVIGLSGGIDSTLNAVLLTQALGKSRVIAANLPTQFNSTDTRSIAQKLAADLGIQFHEIAIEDIAQVNRRLLGNFKPSDFNYENIQAKIRGTSILSNIAGITGGLMCNNGNKVEIALGYATLYGDVNGAISPLGDCTKMDIFAMSKYINRKFGPLIDERILPNDELNFTLPPSAELKPNQIDPMKWGYHDALIEKVCTYDGVGPAYLGKLWLGGTLTHYLGISDVLFTRYKLDQAKIFVEDLEWFFRLFLRGVFKRIQAPPIVLMSRSSFGYDFRESQFASIDNFEWERVRASILDNQKD